MKSHLGTLILMCIASLAANAATVTSSLFSIEVPGEWKVEDNKTSVVLAFGSKELDGVPSPFLSVQYCLTEITSPASGHHRCQKTCDEGAINLTSNAPWNGTQFSPIEKMEMSGGGTEYTSELTSPAPVAALVALSCNDHGQVYFSLVSDQPREEAKRQFLDILRTLKWK